MSRRGSEEPRAYEVHLTVFHGSSPADVSHAGQLWGSVALLPPLESRLISADISQRLPVARSCGSKTPAGPGATGPGSQRRGGGGGREEDEEEVEERRRRSEAMAVRKEEILGLLWSQRERRLRREEVGRPGLRNREALTPPGPRGAAADREAVQLLE
ncbi:unnamed protein product [Arctogadus glacialis]